MDLTKEIDKYTRYRRTLVFAGLVFAFGALLQVGLAWHSLEDKYFLYALWFWTIAVMDLGTAELYKLRVDMYRLFQESREGRVNSGAPAA